MKIYLLSLLFFPVVSFAQTNSWQNTGNIGIGTTSPRAWLDVGATTENTSTSVLGRLWEGNSGSNSPGTGTYLGVQTYNTSVVGGKSFSLEHKFYGMLNSAINFHRGGSTEGGFITFACNNGAEMMRISTNGNVGIGTSNTSNYKLTVNGNIGARKVKVTQETWADFVFQPTYQLPTLHEVEQFIINNQHLPSIPSTAEVEKNGIDLGEMNKRLLQKIEEITLYLIDQDKQIKTQKEETNKLKEEIKSLQEQNKKLAGLLQK
ncbi:hypothetical protein ACE38W_06510 [Chitinophaga sp. Hz27]|uniref:hypothetical protein n=1 Tax=Chitinophaga sp. Hz27 TaxID=3347169 RepID=UPI0035E295C3